MYFRILYALSILGLGLLVCHGCTSSGDSTMNEDERPDRDISVGVIERSDQFDEDIDQSRLDDMSVTLDMMLDTADAEIRLGCESYEPAPTSVLLSEHALPEASGLTISGVNPRILWSHNDSGSASKAIALNSEGRILGSIRLPDMADDLEDIDEAPCPHRAGRCLWLGDIGDNALQRDTLRLWITPEPPVATPFDTVNISSDQIPNHTLSITFTLEGGVADIEAMVVDHDGERIWLFEKREEGPVNVWLLDLNAEEVAERLDAWLRGDLPDLGVLTAQILTSFEAPGVPVTYGRMITSADLSPDGRRVLIRVYTGIYEYRLAEPYALSTLDEIEPIRIALGPINEPQGEALSYGWRGEGVWSISESPESPQPLNYFGCDYP